MSVGTARSRIRFGSTLAFVVAALTFLQLLSNNTLVCLFFGSALRPCKCVCAFFARSVWNKSGSLCSVPFAWCLLL